MKHFCSICMLVIPTMLITNAAAEEVADGIPQAAQGAEMYMEEIKATCRAEAEGMLDAETYIQECINSMKQGFTE